MQDGRLYALAVAVVIITQNREAVKATSASAQA